MFWFVCQMILFTNNFKNKQMICAKLFSSPQLLSLSTIIFSFFAIFSTKS